VATTSALGSALASQVVAPRTLAVAWICQAGFVLKSPGGKLLAIDPYLSNSCKALGEEAGFNMDRLVPPPLFPTELTAFDTLLFSHSHQDHVDPETIAPYLKAGGSVPVIAPHDAAELLKKLGVKPDRITMTWANQTHRVGDFNIRTAFAIPPDGGDMTHVGYIIDVADGPRLYFTCDTDYNDVLPLSVGPYQPDVLLTVINPAFRNLTPRDAAKLAKELNPKWVVPCHHDLFPDNSLSGRLLQTNLTIIGMKDAYCPLKQGEIHVFEVPKDRERPKQALIS
jgi:L-ascorbate 6-phosphate lactonase